MWSAYTLYSGFSYEDFWFLSSSDSKIAFDEQKNMFLGYTEFSFKIDDGNKIIGDSYNNYINPLIYVFILIIFSMIIFIFEIIKFQKKDLS
ncbi:hypothetical protein [Spiroplasma taiwanense]|uniref:hypothetical protein n=1 Tax=Spiroplasma taiwanense TaxID=2145 RepID=UPI0003F71994|nr:hypothetical protein [Spiroplasma taiwanense]